MNDGLEGLRRRVELSTCLLNEPVKLGGEGVDITLQFEEGACHLVGGVVLLVLGKRVSSVHDKYSGAEVTNNELLELDDNIEAILLSFDL